MNNPLFFSLEYPPYQALLLQSEFFEVAIELSKAENETYVRASALKFISVAVKINGLWEKNLCNLNLSVCRKNLEFSVINSCVF